MLTEGPGDEEISHGVCVECADRILEETNTPIVNKEESHGSADHQ